MLAFEKTFESSSKKLLMAKALIGISASIVAILFAALMILYLLVVLSVFLI